MGVIIGIVGGVLWDILCNDVLLVFFKGELYVIVVWIGVLMMIVF